MIGTLVGAMHKKGSFTNEESGELVMYDNLELVILVPIPVGGQYDPIESEGLKPERNSKCSFEKLSEVFGDEFKNVSDLAPLMGREVEYFFDGSKKICKVMVHG